MKTEQSVPTIGQEIAREHVWGSDPASRILGARPATKSGHNSDCVCVWCQEERHLASLIDNHPRVKQLRREYDEWAFGQTGSSDKPGPQGEKKEGDAICAENVPSNASAESKASASNAASTFKPKEAAGVTAHVHVQHYFPKGYDPNAKPWKSIVQCVEQLENRLAAAQVELDGADRVIAHLKQEKAK